MQPQVRTLVIRFKNPIAKHEIPLFRGAVINAVGAQSHDLFHNHQEGEGFHYRYPMIQYKRIHGQAAIVCVGDGVDEIGAFFSTCNFNLRIGTREELFEIEAIEPRKTVVQVWDDMFLYRVCNWLPLNQSNFQIYESLEGIAERTQMLEHTFVGNVLSLCKGMGVRVDKSIDCKMVGMKDPIWVRYKGTTMLSFDCEVKTNITLPDCLGIGKGVSLGYGTYSMIINKK